MSAAGRVDRASNNGVERPRIVLDGAARVGGRAAHAGR
jgi:hypothetical protein